ncbi:hypothetical protein HAX54_017425 [Datura stramonium]|uniref:Uncharacterized protein n=1 Tax=Datura stramonium TaxID=4076 RepID=A0ABS8UNL6_DATST|nr:hypothetical protein [Datura stramonium]
MSSLYTRANGLISLCGWEPRWLPNVQDCEEHSAQSVRVGTPLVPQNITLLQDFGHGENFVWSHRENLGLLTVVRPACFAPNSNDIPETSKKMAHTWCKCCYGISGWVAADGVEKEQIEDLDEAATNEEGRSLSNIGVDLNLTMAGGLSSSQVNMDARPEPFQDVHQPADSVEGTVIDRDGDEVNDGSQYLAGPSKRPCQSDAFMTHHTTYGKDSSGAGPSLSLGFEIGTGAPVKMTPKDTNS